MSGGGGGAPARYVSVSELYSADEVELLLEEIRELEPTACRGEELADFEIAGSGAARSPAHTERSWDSHAHYSRVPRPPPERRVPVYCRLSYLADLHALLTITIILCGAATCSCVWAVTGLRGRLPLDSRARLLALGGFSSALLHAVLFLVHLTKLTNILPLQWDKLALWTSLWSGWSQAAGGVLTLHAVLLEPAYRYTPYRYADLLYAAAGLGMSGACASFIIVFRLSRTCLTAARAAAVAEAGAGGAGAGAGEGGEEPYSRPGGDSRGTYRAVPSAPQPSTSRHDQL